MTGTAHILHLSARHTATFERHGFGVRVAESASRLLRWVSLRWSRMVLAAALKQYTSFLEDEALWFRGAAAALDATGRSADIDHGHTHIDLLRRHEEQLLLRRVAVLSIAESAGASHTGEYLAAQARLSASALSDCFEAVRELRGALQAFDADCSAMRQALQHQAREASAPDQLDRALDDIFNRA